MDESTGSSATTKAVLAVAGILLLALPARDAFGDRGVTAVLLVALAVVAVLAFADLTERPLGWPVRRADAEVAPEPQPDEWRSERWVREAAERGLRALEDWRLEQREA